MPVHTRVARTVLAAAAFAGLASALAGCQAAATSATAGDAPATTAAATVTAPATVLATSSAANPGVPSTASSAPASSGSAITACSAAELTVKTGLSQAAAGHSYLVLVFTDSGARSCSLQGFPGAELTTAGGGKLDAVRGAGSDASPVTLAPGGSASAVLDWEHFPSDGSSEVTTADCAGYGATVLLVTAPNQTTSTRLSPPETAPVCWGFEVGVVVPGSTGRA